MNIPLTATLLKTFDPFWLSPVRYVIAVFTLAVWLLVTQGASQFRSPIALPRVLILSLLIAAFLIFFNLGLLYTHPMTAAAVMAGSPVYVAIVARLMTGTKLERGFWGAAILTVIGAGIAVYGRASGTGPSAGQVSGQSIDPSFDLRGGEIFLILSISGWTVYSILAQRWFVPAVTQLRRTFLTAAFALPWLVLFWGLARVVGLAGEPNLQPSAQEVLYIALTAVFSSALAVVAWNNGVARLGINAGSVWQNMVPVFAVLISLVFFDIWPTRGQFLGGVIVFAGVIYLQWHKVRR